MTKLYKAFAMNDGMIPVMMDNQNLPYGALTREQGISWHQTDGTEMTTEHLAHLVGDPLMTGRGRHYVDWTQEKDRCRSS